MDIGEMYELYSKDMMRYAVSLLRNCHDAEDAVSDCFLRLMKSARFPEIPDGKKKAYAFTALRNLCVTALRERGRAEAEKYSVNGEPFEPACDGASDTAADMERALMLVNPSCRSVLRLRFIGDLSIRDISGELGLKENNVKIMIHRGKKQLAEYLGDRYIG